MRLAILSDTHDRVATVHAALSIIHSRRVDLIVHCGDIEEVDTARLFPKHTHFVFGNCDMHRNALRTAMQDLGAKLHEPFGHLEIDGVNLAFVHGDDKTLLRELEQSAAFDFLFYGHTHIAKEHQVGKTRVINPGALHRARPKTFVVLDLPSGEIESIIVE